MIYRLQVIGYIYCMKVYREWFHNLQLPPFSEVEGELLNIVAGQPVRIVTDHSFLPEQPYTSPFVQFKKNYTTGNWDTITKIELVEY